MDVRVLGLISCSAFSPLAAGCRPACVLICIHIPNFGVYGLSPECECVNSRRSKFLKFVNSKISKTIYVRW